MSRPSAHSLSARSSIADSVARCSSPSVPRISATKRSSLARSSAALPIIANLFVNLQPIALAVGNDDAVGCRIELHRRREAETPLRLEGLYPAPRLLHIGVVRDGLLAPFRQHLGIADELGDRLSLGVEDANPM